MRFLETLRIDAKVNGAGEGRLAKIAAILFYPSLNTLFFYRLSASFRNVPVVGRFASKLLWRASLSSGCHISIGADIGAGLAMPHPVGIVIGEGSRIGRNVSIYQNVTIGRLRPDGGYPAIEDGVTIYAGAVLIGPITVGKGAVVGANSVVLKDIPPFHIAAGVPARLLSGSSK